MSQNLIRIVGIHQRTPGIPALPLPTCWPPSPCDRLSRPPRRVVTPATTTGPPPHPAPSTDDASIPPARMDSRQQERPGMVPVFTANRSISLAPSFAPAASPRLRRRLSPWPPHRHAEPATELTIHHSWPRTAPRPISTRLEPVPRLRSFTTGSSRMPSDPARRTRPIWQSQAVPALSALLPDLPVVSRIGLRSAPTRLLRQPSEEDLHLLRFPAPHGARGSRLRRLASAARRHPGARMLVRAAHSWLTACSALSCITAAPHGSTPCTVTCGGNRRRGSSRRRCSSSPSTPRPFVPISPRRPPTRVTRSHDRSSPARHLARELSS